MKRNDNENLLIKLIMFHSYLTYFLSTSSISGSWKICNSYNTLQISLLPEFLNEWILEGLHVAKRGCVGSLMKKYISR